MKERGNENSMLIDCKQGISVGPLVINVGEICWLPVHPELCLMQIVHSFWSGKCQLDKSVKRV